MFEQVDEMTYEKIKQWSSDSRGERIYSGSGTISFKQKALRVAKRYIQDKMDCSLADDELDDQAEQMYKNTRYLAHAFCDYHFEGKKKTDFF